MGGNKRNDEFEQERGWHDKNKSVCEECLEDEYLKSIVRKNIEFEHCDYCESSASQGVGAAFKHIMTAVAAAMKNYFTPYSASGAPIREFREFAMERDTREALGQLPLYGEQTLIDDIVNSFIEDNWVEAAHGSWGSDQHGAIMSNAWSSFKNQVMYSNRYCFGSISREKNNHYDRQDLLPTEILAAIGSCAEQMGLIRDLKVGTKYYRARPGFGHKNYSSIGPPPFGKAGNGRMNPAGISYFYLADNIHTALAEVNLTDGEQASVGAFKLQRDIKVIDFSVLPGSPSIFDSKLYEIFEVVRFWHKFELDIRKPINKDDQLSYIPSQVLSEYFAKIFACKDGSKIDGFYYESTTSSAGKNLVIFPEAKKGIKWEAIAELEYVDSVVVKSPVSGFTKIKTVKLL